MVWFGLAFTAGACECGCGWAVTCPLVVVAFLYELSRIASYDGSNYDDDDDLSLVHMTALQLPFSLHIFGSAQICSKHRWWNEGKEQT